MKSALITGITGQDGFFLTEFLLEKGYRVIGFSRNEARLKDHFSSHFGSDVQMFFGGLSSELDIASVIESTKPDEIYNLASQSSPRESWAQASETLIANGLGAIRLFEAVRTRSPATRVCHASSSELFGQATQVPQNENTPFNAANPYAASKLYAHQMAKIYRENHHLYIANAILFNHESEHRPLHFVSQKIAYGAACAALGILNSPDTNETGVPIVFDGKLALGNFDVMRDWGYAPDFVRAMWLMLQQDKADDFVIGTGLLHTLRELCEIAYRHAGHRWQDHVFSDPALFSPLGISQTVADATKAHQILGWEPSVGFQEMIETMVDAQIKRLS